MKWNKRAIKHVEVMLNEVPTGGDEVEHNEADNCVNLRD